MGRKTALFLAILTALTLSACGENAAETVIETEQVTTVSEVTTTAETTVEVTTVTEAETSATETEAVTAETASEESTLPVVYSADEKYEYYPMEVIYPEKQETDITAETVETAEDLCNADGYCIVRFEANYPVFSSESVDSAVLDKINQQVKAHIDEAYEYERTYAEEYIAHEENEFAQRPYTLCGFIHERQLKYDIGYSECVGFDVCGNILSVNFVDYYYGAGAAHGMEAPVLMMFNLATGERIDIAQLVSDIEGFDQKVRLKSIEHGDPAPLTNDDEVIAMHKEFVGGIFDEDIKQSNVLLISEDNDNYRYSVKKGCICYYLAPYEYGPYIAGIRCVEIPISEMLPYMNDEGKALFEGVVSATAEPVMLTVEDGKEKIISREQAEEMLSEREE
ncbi:MAG: DUF4163 domain-containing protein [Oscillospiraceae bacterium]|nr:DUF4163 domain-containing protein [Oscillospiraceae bacterium]